MSTQSWRELNAFLLSILIHAFLWPVKESVRKETYPSWPIQEISIFPNPPDEPVGTFAPTPDLGRGPEHGRSIGKRLAEGAPGPASSALVAEAPASTETLAVGPSLDWLYAIVAARGDGDGSGAGGGPGLMTPAHPASEHWTGCTSPFSHPAVAHVIVDVDAQGRPLRAHLVDADPGTEELAVRCAMQEKYIPSRLVTTGQPVQGRTNRFRVHFLPGPI